MRNSFTGSLILLIAPLALSAQARQAGDPKCAADNGGLKLPTGFCATVFADSLAGPRHLVVAPNGDVFVSLQGRGRDVPGGVIGLRDTNGDGRADQRDSLSGFRSSEVVLFDGSLYTENMTAVLRYRLPNGALAPSGTPDTIVKDLPGGGHFAKTFVIGRDGALYVNVGSRTNVCQEPDRKARVAGADPCTELETRAGIWKFDARKLGQTEQTGVHYARGIRNAVGITINPADNKLYVTQHGRDNLSDYSEHYSVDQSAESPAEEMFQVNQGDDFGWPYCYFDTEKKLKLVNPEYGGDGKTVGRCADKKGNVAWFPGHWAPNGLFFYTGTNFPARYRNGAFIAFHGSWNRPVPQGYRIVFQPMQNGRASGAYETFADGFLVAGSRNRRPTGLAQGPDGALYITDDTGGRIWKVTYTGQ